ncbi:SDR family NAD(P)-dependent oxidoreductase [Membranihabitans maritimus]|uniref:SDR family NAD(P)-dependent oxidoreductase n=1 Tax=Membranihabitans maritimus TaxID=2904244 RepID=UPI001F2DC05F|nr:SDR family NAD(P)-dependent oxidoreductase [Membranihabitans maritimus]
MVIKDKVFVVSGAASGLGLSTAKGLIDKGGKIIALDISAEKLDKLGNEFPESVLTFKTDVQKEQDIANALEISYSNWGRLDAAIACAGVAPGEKIYSRSKGSHSSESFENVIGINLMGTFNLLNVSVPYMVKNEGDSTDGEKGVFIATSSVAAYEGQIGQVAYAASKGGVASLILPAARELANSGIRVNAIAPGIFKTPMVENFPEEVQSSLAQQIPFPRRLGQPEEFAALVVSILTNKMINGTIIRLDGAVRMGAK